MIDNEIKISLELFISELDKKISSDKVMIVNEEGMRNLLKIIGNSLALINRQQAEIERLTEETMNMAITIETCKAEAIKEFAERLKEKKNAVCAGHGLTTYAVDEYDIDCILKEMVGETE